MFIFAVCLQLSSGFTFGDSVTFSVVQHSVKFRVAHCCELVASCLIHLCAWLRVGSFVHLCTLSFV